MKIVFLAELGVGKLDLYRCDLSCVCRLGE